MWKRQWTWFCVLCNARWNSESSYALVHLIPPLLFLCFKARDLKGFELCFPFPRLFSQAQSCNSYIVFVMQAQSCPNTLSLEMRWTRPHAWSLMVCWIQLLLKASHKCKRTRPVHLRRNARFWTVITVPAAITPYSTVKSTVGQNYGVRPYSTVPPYSTILTVIWPFGSNNGLKYFFSFCDNCLWVKHKLLARNQVMRPTLSFRASHCWAHPPSWCRPNPALASFREALCGVNT